MRHNRRYPASVVCVSWGCAAAGRAQWMTPSPATCRCTIESDAKTQQILRITTSRAKVPFSKRTMSSHSTKAAIEETSVRLKVTSIVYFFRERHCFLSAYTSLKLAGIPPASQVSGKIDEKSPNLRPRHHSRIAPQGISVATVINLYVEHVHICYSEE